MVRSLSNMFRKVFQDKVARFAAPIHNTSGLPYKGSSHNFDQSATDK